VLVAGCSSGAVLFFESIFGTLLVNIKRHEADIKCLAYCPETNLVYATGLDSKIIILSNLKEN